MNTILEVPIRSVHSCREPLGRLNAITKELICIICIICTCTCICLDSKHIRWVRVKVRAEEQQSFKQA